MAGGTNEISRRDFLKRAGVAGAAVALGSALGASAPATAEATTSTPGPAIGSSWPHPPKVWLTQDKDVSGDCMVVLGLGAGPVFYPDRNNSAFALFHNGNAYLIDAGAGAVNQFMKLGITLDKVKGLFFTHYHIDHTAGYADLLSRGSQANGPDHNLKTLNVYGPTAPQVGGVNGLDVLTNGVKAGFGPGYDLHFWAKPYVGAPPQAPGPRPTVNTVKITPNQPTSLAAIPILTDDPDVQVETIEVDHDEEFGTCYAYRFELLNAGVPTGKSIVFSGDRANYNARRDFSPSSPYYAKGAPGDGKTAYFPEHPTNQEFQEAFSSFAQGATVLVHEAAVNASATRIADPNAPAPFPKALYWHLVDSHTDVNEVPKIAQDARAGAVVLCHYGDYTQLGLKEASGIIRAAVLKANETVQYRGKIFAPVEMDVIHF
jgi:ribonuclease BN (tRNA processing enzyme)